MTLFGRSYPALRAGVTDLGTQCGVTAVELAWLLY